MAARHIREESEGRCAVLTLTHDDRITSKRCSGCKQVKPVSAFYYHAAGRRWKSRCKPCQAAYIAEYRQAHRDRLLVLQREARLRRLDHYRRVNLAGNYRRKRLASVAAEQAA
jgi:hypothetical protein